MTLIQKVQKIERPGRPTPCIKKRYKMDANKTTTPKLKLDFSRPRKPVRPPECVLCGSDCENQWGNNPYPVKHDGGDRGKCCDYCNLTQVLPARFAAAAARR